MHLPHPIHFSLSTVNPVFFIVFHLRFSFWIYCSECRLFQQVRTFLWYSYLTVTNIYEIREKIILPALQTKKRGNGLQGHSLSSSGHSIKKRLFFHILFSTLNFSQCFLKLHGKQNRRKCHCKQVRDRLSDIDRYCLIGCNDQRHDVDQRNQKDELPHYGYNN